MLNLIVLFINFKLIFVSIIGYGFAFNKLFFKNSNLEIIGFIGLSFLTFLSLISSIFVRHDYLHNLSILIVGFIFFFIFVYKDVRKIKYSKKIFLLSLILFPILITAATHNDFNYYHLPFTRYLTENKVVFGIGHANHGYNFMSSLFYLNSIFVVPFTKYNSLHFSSLYFLIFFNYFLLNFIFNNDNKNFELKFLSFLSFLFFNIIFLKIDNFGTDYTGQLLIIVLFIYLIKSIDIKTDKIKIENLSIFIFLLIFSITLKTIYVTYVLLTIVILFDLFNKKKTKLILPIIFSKIFIICILFVFANSFHHFAHSGCFISPIKITCFPKHAFWSVDHVTSGNLAIYVEFWAKGGVGLFKNVTYEMMKEYNSNFKWLGHYTSTYLFGNLFTSMKIGFVSLILSIVVFYNFEFYKIKTLKFNKIYFINLIILISIFWIWFDKHPQLRYGGYVICFLLGIYLTLPLIKNIFQKNNNFTKNAIFLCSLIILGKVFISVKQNYTFLENQSYQKFPYYNVEKPHYRIFNHDKNLTINYAVSSHCGITKSICAQRGGDWLKLMNIKNINGYYFLEREYGKK